MSYKMLKQAFLILTDNFSTPVEGLYKNIQVHAKGRGDVILVYHSTGVIPKKVLEIDHYPFTDNILDCNGYNAIERRLIPGSNHFPLFDFYLKNPHYDYYWLIENDVRFNGSWLSFFDTFSQIHADLISCHIRAYLEEPDWHWWNSFRHPDFFIPMNLRVRSFNPIYRISNIALNYVHHLLIDGWQGHHEVLLPTLLHLEGFKLIDFGGVGRFVMPGFENRFYLNNEPNEIGFLNTGSMRYRPLITPAEMSQEMLYHPVKSSGT